MSLPKGFGSGYDEPEKEQPRKCKLGKACNRGYGNHCSIHGWIYRHDEAWPLLVAAVGMSLFILLAVSVVILNHTLGEPTRQIINGYNCQELAQHIANKLSWYDYAEHRYEWLCVNEQIKEFGND